MEQLRDAFNKELKPEEDPLSERTVRYYVAQGLIPRPERSGQRALYTQGHLDRFRLIKRLKEQEFLPLDQIKEIISQLDDTQIKAALESAAEPPQRAHAKQLIARLLADSAISTTHATEMPHTPRPATATPPPREERWRHIELADGLLLLVRQPVPHETEELVRKIIAMSQSPTEHS
jgi:DNA-binding transcriptional MerR regulator